MEAYYSLRKISELSSVPINSIVALRDRATSPRLRPYSCFKGIREGQASFINTLLFGQGLARLSVPLDDLSIIDLESGMSGLLIERPLEEVLALIDHNLDPEAFAEAVIRAANSHYLTRT